MTARPWFWLLALGVVSLLASGATAGTIFGIFLLFMAAGFLIAAAVNAFQTRRDPYDLRTLQEVHEMGDYEEEPVEEDVEFDSVVCIRCGSRYSTDFASCPHCRC